MRTRVSSEKLLLTSHPDDTGVHQLLDLGSDAGVLEMLLQSRGVVLGLLEDGLHDGVLENADNLSVSVKLSYETCMGRYTSGSRWIRSMVCCSVSPSRAEYCACRALASCC